MAERIYNFCKKYHPKTNVMVSGVRKPKGAHLAFMKPPYQDFELNIGLPWVALHAAKTVRVRLPVREL